MKYAYEVYCQRNESTVLEGFGYGDLSSQKQTFLRIMYAVRGKDFTEPSFINQTYMQFGLESPFPIRVELDTNDAFWFQYIMSIPFDEFFFLHTNFIVNRRIQRLAGPPTSLNMNDFLVKFHDKPAAIEYVRQKFILSEDISDTAKLFR